MGRNSHSAGKRRREAERERKKREKRERARQRRAESGGGVEIASVDEIQTAAVNATVEGILADGTILSGNEQEGGSSGPPCRLFVGGLSWETTAAQLREVFAAHGEVVDAVIVKDRDTGDSRGFGFVTMGDRKMANKVMRELGGTEVDGRSIRVDMATER